MNTNERVHDVLASQVCRINETLNKISHGGCGLFALEMHKSLLRHGIVTKVVLVNLPYSKKYVDRMIGSTGCTNINDAYNHLFDNADSHGHVGRNTCNGHVAVELDGVLYDNDGVLNQRAVSDHITPDTMDRFLTHDAHWNGTFKRNNKGVGDLSDITAAFFDSMLTEHLGGTIRLNKR